MSAISSDLEQFLEVVGKVSAVVAEDGRSVGDGWDSVEGAGLPTLARDSADETDSLQWLAHTVRVAAASSPSLAYVLAARYTADLAISDGVARRPTFALASPHSRPVAATSPEPDAVVALGVDDWQVRLARWDGVADSAEVEPRTGLTDARQASFTVPQDAELCESDGRALMTTWDLLIGAALVGIAERALDVTSTYVAERRQFGVPIGSFAGLRALVAGM
ncbi:MAG: hypothetical protein ACXWDJ_09550, partial [Aeromicrobium sp.]